MSMTHLFLFTIGPVQSFIAQARKTRDLYAGSQILSELVEAGMNAFPGTVIFPNKGSQSKPNRFLGWVNHAGDDDALRDMGKAVEDAVRAAWQRMAKDAVEGLGPSRPNGYDEQIQNALQVFWVFQSAKEETYHIAYRDIERTLGAIKNVRPVRQYHYQMENEETVYGERGRKCSLDGERNVKFYRMGSTDKNGEGYAVERKLFLRNKDEVAIIRDRDGVGMGDLPPGEGLSAVSWVKRRYTPEGKESEFESFQSTAMIAALHFEDQANMHPALGQKYELFRSCFKKTWDAQLLFEENHTTSYYHKQGIESGFASPSKAVESLKSLFGKYKDQEGTVHNIKHPSGYYALLLFDGDSMGKWLSGANLQAGRNEGAELKQFHEDLAEKLGKFSQNAFQELNGVKGRAIYAGGDDFLGFINLEHLFDVLSWMRVQFDEQINQKLDHKNKKESFTFSGGLLIAHYKTPLHVVLDWARATEKAAKKYIHPHGQRKDTLGISVMRASGEITQAFVPWNLDDNPGAKKRKSSVTNLEAVTESLRNTFSDKWIRSLSSEFSVMQDQEGKLKIEQGEDDLGGEMVKAELKRLLARACSKHGDERDAAVQDLLSHLHSLLGPNPTENFGNFIKTLLICDFIERHTYGKQTEKETSK